MRLSILLLSLCFSGFAAERSLVYRSSWLAVGPPNFEISPYYIVIESVELDSYVARHFPDTKGRERTKLIQELKERAPIAKALIRLMGAQFKASVRRHGKMTPTYEADIDARLALSQQGKARLVGLFSGDVMTGEFEVYAMAAIYPDFGEGVPLQITDGRWISAGERVAPTKPTKEKVRVFGSGVQYFEENIELSTMASTTDLYWGDQLGISFFTVPRDSFFYPDPKRTLPGIGKIVIDWKVYLLNLTIADGLLRFGERAVPGGSYRGATAADPAEIRRRGSAFREVQREPYLEPELLGLKPQTKCGVSEILLFTRSQTLVDLLFKPLGFSYLNNYFLPGDETEHHLLRISREDLEGIALERLRQGMIAINPGYERTQVSRHPYLSGALYGELTDLEAGIIRCAEELDRAYTM